MSVARTLLALSGHYSIDLVAKDTNTYSIQVFDCKNQVPVTDLPLDLVDNTLAAMIDKNAIAKLGPDVVPVLETLSQQLQKEIGAKEFIILPPGCELPGYVPAEKAEFQRLRHASRQHLEKSTSVILEKYQDLVAKLDREHEIVNGMDALTQKLPNPYDSISAFLKAHADFTPEKMVEYMQGIKPRFNNSSVTTMALVSQQGLSGLVRSLSMGSKFSYLSDETLNQEILPLENFDGYTPQEKMQNRAIFLLAYLANRMVAQAKDQDHFVMIAASGRESIYEAVGFQTFPIKANDYVVMLKLGKPGPLLTSLKEKLIQSSVAVALNKFSLMAPPILEPANVEEEERSFSLSQ